MMGVNQYIIKLYSIPFSKNEVIILQDVLRANFKLKSRIEEKVKNQWIIYIPIKQKYSLKDIVKPYMHESMFYKI
jgi:hypothetical protein